MKSKKQADGWACREHYPRAKIKTCKVCAEKRKQWEDAMRYAFKSYCKSNSEYWQTIVK